MIDYCQFSTTKPKGALSQAAQRGNPTRYKRCRNRATTSVTITVTNLHTSYEREVKCCGLHKRLHEERGFMP